MQSFPIKVFLNESSLSLSIVCNLSPEEISEEQMKESLETFVNKIQKAVTGRFKFCNFFPEWNFEHILAGKTTNVQLVNLAQKSLENVSNILNTKKALKLAKDQLTNVSSSKKSSKRSKENKIKQKIKSLNAILDIAKQRANFNAVVLFSSSSDKESLACLKTLAQYIQTYILTFCPQFVDPSSTLSLTLQQTFSLIDSLQSRISLVPQPLAIATSMNLDPFKNLSTLELLSTLKPVITDTDPITSSKKDQENPITSSASLGFKKYLLIKSRQDNASTAKTPYPTPPLPSFIEIPPSKTTALSLLHVSAEEHFSTESCEEEEEMIQEELLPSIDIGAIRPRPLEQSIASTTSTLKRKIQDEDSVSTKRQKITTEPSTSTSPEQPAPCPSIPPITLPFQTLVPINNNYFVLIPLEISHENKISYIEKEIASLTFLINHPKFLYIPSTASLSELSPLEKKQRSLKMLFIHTQIILAHTQSLNLESRTQLTALLKDNFECLNVQIKTLSEISNRQSPSTTSSRIPTSSEEVGYLQHNFAAITFQNFSKSFRIQSREKMPSNSNMQFFLHQVQEAIKCNEYSCTKTIPEIEPKTSNNQFLILKALYAAVIRNQYFFNLQLKNIGKSCDALNVEIMTVLNLINWHYSQMEAPITNIPLCDHHPELTALHVGEIPLQPIKIPKPISIITIYMEKLSSNRFYIQTTHFEQQQHLHKQIESIQRKFNRNSQYYKTLPEQQSFFIKCPDNSYPLRHEPKTALLPAQLKEILITMIKRNKQQILAYFTPINWQDEPLFVYSKYLKLIKTIDEHQAILDQWEIPFLTDTSKSPIQEKKSNLSSSIDTSNDSEDNDLLPISQTIFFPKIKYDAKQKRLTISRYLKNPSRNNLLFFLSEIKKAKNSTSYICKEEIPGIISDPNPTPKTILTNLFKLVHILVNASEQRLCAFSTDPFLSEELISTFYDIDISYRQMEPTDTQSRYHPDLQKIADNASYEIPCPLKANLTASKMFTFSYSFIRISWHQKRILILPKNIYIGFHVTFIAQCLASIKRICKNLIKLTRLPSSATFTTSSSDPNYTVGSPGFLLQRDEALQHCLNILLTTQSNLLNNNSFSSLRHLPRYKTLKKTVSDTIASIQHTLQPEHVEKISSLSFTPHGVSLIFLNKTNNNYHIYMKEFVLCPSDPFEKTVERYCRITYKWLKNLFLKTSSLSILCEKTSVYDSHIFANAVEPLPFLYRGLQQNFWQIEHLFKKSSTTTKVTKLKPYWRKSKSSINKSLLLLEQQWNHLYQDDIPLLNELPHPLQGRLPFTEASLAQFISEIQDLPTPIDPTITAGIAEDHWKESFIESSDDAEDIPA